MSFFGINAAGIKSKLRTFDNVLDKAKPDVFLIQETKLKPNEKIECELVGNYDVYYLNRKMSLGGGVAIGVNKEIESTHLTEGNDEVEVLSLHLFLGKLTVRTIVGYGPQENAPIRKKEKFWEFLENEVNEAELKHEAVVIQMDGNVHVGSNVIPNDPNEQNRNGALFEEFLSRYKQLFVVNSLDICDGVITRQRILKT